jgi:hypothetical protein
LMVPLLSGSQLSALPRTAPPLRSTVLQAAEAETAIEV